MKQNKQSICLAAPPLRQCVFLGYLLFLLLPACTIGEDGADNGPSGNRGEVVLLQPRFYTGQPSTRSVVNGLESSEAARALLAAGAARVGLVTAAKTVGDKGGALFAPARELPSFVQILRGK